MNDTEITTREARTLAFKEKNVARKTCKQKLLSEKDGLRRYRNARSLRRNALNGAFGNLEGHDYNEYVEGTTGEPKIDEGDAEG